MVSRNAQLGHSTIKKHKKVINMNFRRKTDLWGEGRAVVIGTWKIL